MPSPAAIDAQVPKPPEKHLSDALLEIFQTLHIKDVTPDDIITRFNKSGGIDRVRIAIDRRMKQFNDAQKRHTLTASEQFLNTLPDTEGPPPQKLIQQAQDVVLASVKDRIGRDVDIVTEQGTAPWFLECVKEEIINACKEDDTAKIEDDLVPTTNVVDGAKAILKNLTRNVTRVRQVEHAQDPAKLSSKKEQQTNGHTATATNEKLSHESTANGKHAPNETIATDSKEEKLVEGAADSDQKENNVLPLSSEDKNDRLAVQKPKQKDRPPSTQALPSSNKEQPTGASEAMAGVKEESNPTQSEKVRTDYDSLAGDLLMGGDDDTHDDSKEQNESKAVKGRVSLSNSEVHNASNKKSEAQPEKTIVPDKESLAIPTDDPALHGKKAEEQPEKTIGPIKENLENTIALEKEGLAKPYDDSAPPDKKTEEQPKTIGPEKEKLENTIVLEKEGLAKPSDDSAPLGNRAEEQPEKRVGPEEEKLEIIAIAPEEESGAKHADDSVLKSQPQEMKTELLVQAKAAETKREHRHNVPTSESRELSDMEVDEERSVGAVLEAAEDITMQTQGNAGDGKQQEDDMKAESAKMYNHVQDQADQVFEAVLGLEKANLEKQTKCEGEENQRTAEASQVQSNVREPVKVDTEKAISEKQPKGEGGESQDATVETSSIQNKVDETVKAEAEKSNSEKQAKAEDEESQRAPPDSSHVQNKVDEPVTADVEKADSKEQTQGEAEQSQRAAETSHVQNQACEPVHADAGTANSEKQAKGEDDPKSDKEGNRDAQEKEAKSEDLPDGSLEEGRDTASGVKIPEAKPNEKESHATSKKNAQDAGEYQNKSGEKKVPVRERSDAKESSTNGKNEEDQQQTSGKEEIPNPVGNEKESTLEKDVKSGQSDIDRRHRSGSDVAQTATRKATSPTRRVSSRRSSRTIPKDEPDATDLGKTAKETAAQKTTVAKKEKKRGRSKRKFEENTDVQKESKRKNLKSDGTKNRKEVSEKKRRRSQTTEDRTSLTSQPSAGRPDPAVENWPRGYGIVRSCAPEDFEAQQKVLHAIKMLLEKEYVSPFSEPVDASEKGLEMYTSIIKNPMDLGEICKRLENSSAERGYYLNVSEVVQDIELVWWNCKRYNGQFDPIIGACEQAQNELSFLLEQHGIEAEKGTQKRRRVSRGQAPSMKKPEEDAELGDNDGRLVGKTILVFTELMKRRKKKEWFSVEVRAYDPKSKSYTLLWVNEKKTTKKATFGPDKMYPVYRV